MHADLVHHVLRIIEVQDVGMHVHVGDDVVGLLQLVVDVAAQHRRVDTHALPVLKVFLCQIKSDPQFLKCFTPDDTPY